MTAVRPASPDGPDALPAPPPLRVLMATSEWPTPEHPADAPFIARSVEFLRRNGVQVDVFHFRGAGNPLRYARAWRDLRRRVRAARYDLLHAQFGQSGLLALPKPLPLVVTFRGSDVEGIVGRSGRYTPAGWIMRQGSRLVARAADAVIVVAARMAERLPHRPVHVIPSGLDLARFRPVPRAEARARLGLSPENALVLVAGNMTNPRKRFALAREAVEAVRLPGRAVELVVAHAVPPDRMPDYMNACDALLLASLHEGSPNVVKEALACNLPVVSTDVGDVRERLARVTGSEVVADASVAALAAALTRVLQAPERPESRDSVLELDEQALTARLIAIYRNVAATSSR